MSFEYRDNVLHCDGVPLLDIARRAGTPSYVYSADAILARYREYDESFGDVEHEVCYAVKANGNVSVLRLLAQAGAGFDIVSGGELYRVLQAGGNPDRIVFSGVGKTAEDIEYALAQKIHTFNCESEPEIELINALAARRSLEARIAIRVNPDVDAATHPYISTGMSEHKFGIDIADVEQVYARALRHKNVVLEGVSCHIGSQILNTAPLLESLERMLDLVDRLRSQRVPIRHLDLGGGLGVAYKPTDQPPNIGELVSWIRERVRGRNVKIMVEPGRSIVGAAGVLLARVLYRKQTPRKEFIVVDAAMNDLIRPALYQSHHEILPVRQVQEGQTTIADVVGPVCETGDFLARNREMPNVFPGDLLAVMTSGAYGFVQSSNYNARPRVAEIMVEGNEWRVIRQREKFEDLTRGE